MPKLGWLTDIHLNFLNEDQLQQYLYGLAAESLDGLLISGDIGEADTLVRYLGEIAETVDRPIYFVLGNHDFYFGGIGSTRQEVREACQRDERLHWLSEEAAVSFGPGVALVGHDGWADGQNGDFFGSRVALNDYRLIEDLRELDKDVLYEILNGLARQACHHFKRVVPSALEAHQHVVVLTHVPPYWEAAWHRGKKSDSDYAPHFSNRIVGETLNTIMAEFPGKRLTVLCGHTHGSGVYQPAANIVVKTGGATYREPRLQEVFDL